MNGKRARELRKVARLLSGPEAPDAGYRLEQQRGADGQPMAAVKVLKPGESTGGEVYRDAAGVPVYRTVGLELRLVPGAIRTLYQRLKLNYGRVKP